MRVLGRRLLQLLEVPLLGRSVQLPLVCEETETERVVTPMLRRRRSEWLAGPALAAGLLAIAFQLVPAVGQSADGTPRKIVRDFRSNLPDIAPDGYPEAVLTAIAAFDEDRTEDAVEAADAVLANGDHPPRTMALAAMVKAWVLREVPDPEGALAAAAAALEYAARVPEDDALHVSAEWTMLMADTPSPEGTITADRARRMTDFAAAYPDSGAAVGAISVIAHYLPDLRAVAPVLAGLEAISADPNNQAGYPALVSLLQFCRSARMQGEELRLISRAEELYADTPVGRNAQTMRTKLQTAGGGGCNCGCGGGATMPAEQDQGETCGCCPVQPAE